MKKNSTIALVAHDNRKGDMVEWVKKNGDKLLNHNFVCTGTTGRLVEEAFTRHYAKEFKSHKPILRLKSGPLGGDQQLGAMIAEGKIDIMIFFWDPMQAQPHDVDVKALLRIASLYNIPIATNLSTADFIISSPLFDGDYTPVLRDYSGYIQRTL